MGVLFNDMHVRVAKAIQDSVVGTANEITAAADNGQKRSSAQRSKDIMAGRYWVWSLFRIANKKLFYGEQALALAGTSVGYGSLAAFNVTSVGDLVARVTTPIKTPVPIYHGEDLELYETLMTISKRNEIVAGLVNDNSASIFTPRLKVLLGNGLPDQDTSHYTLIVGYYDNPKLEELTAATTPGDLTEPRSWYEPIERYAEFLGWTLSGNTARGQDAYRQAVNDALFLISAQYGAEATERVRQFLKAGGSQ